MSYSPKHSNSLSDFKKTMWRGDEVKSIDLTNGRLFITFMDGSSILASALCGYAAQRTEEIQTMNGKVVEHVQTQ